MSSNGPDHHVRHDVSSHPGQPGEPGKLGQPGQPAQPGPPKQTRPQSTGNTDGVAAAPADRAAAPSPAHADPHAFPTVAGDWAANNVVDRRGGFLCRRLGSAVRRGEATGPAAANLQRRESDQATEPAIENEQGSAADASGLASFSRRRGAGRRLSDFSRAAEEGDFTAEQFLFVMAIDAFKRANDVAFPAWTDVLEIVRLLGYRKTCHTELEVPSAEDWVERPDAKSNVRPEGWEKRAA